MAIERGSERANKPAFLRLLRFFAAILLGVVWLARQTTFGSER
jgi:hypothetical protein